MSFQEHPDVNDAPEGEAEGIAVVRASDVKPERVRWLWSGRIPLGKLTVLDGDPGLGKSTITLDLGARVTTGSPLPGSEDRFGPTNVVFLSAEDGVGDTIRPRLEAAGADLKRVVIVDHVNDGGGPRPPELPTDLERIRDVVKAEGAALVVVDPLMAFLTSDVNSNRDQDVRRVLHQLKLVAEKTGAAVLVLRHLNKAVNLGGSALYRGGGSIGIIGAARSGLLVAPDPDDENDSGRRILAVSKSNLAAKADSLTYRIVADELYDVAKVAWEGTSGRTAEQLLSRPTERPSPEQDRAEEFLLQALANGPERAADLRKRAEGKGLAWRTVQRAAEALEVDMEQRPEAGKRGPGPSWWWLPGVEDGAEPESGPGMHAAIPNVTRWRAFRWCKHAGQRVARRPEWNARQHAIGNRPRRGIRVRGASLALRSVRPHRNHQGGHGWFPASMRRWCPRPLPGCEAPGGRAVSAGVCTGPGCGASLKGRPATARYCSPGCRRRAERQRARSPHPAPDHQTVTTSRRTRVTPVDPARVLAALEAFQRQLAEETEASLRRDLSRWRWTSSADSGHPRATPGRAQGRRAEA